MRKNIATTPLFLFLCFALNAQNNSTDRLLWLKWMDKMARPVLSNLADDKLKEKMHVELTKNVDNAANRTSVSYLEAFGRTLSGIAPWLTLEGGSTEEIALRNQYRQWVFLFFPAQL